MPRRADDGEGVVRLAVDDGARAGERAAAGGERILE
jgi:hypothetical protein